MSCSHKDDEIMKRATQDTPQFHGAKDYKTLGPTATDEEINAICDKCDKFKHH